MESLGVQPTDEALKKVVVQNVIMHSQTFYDNILAICMIFSYSGIIEFTYLIQIF